MKTRINVGQASCLSHLPNHPLKRKLILKTSETGWKPVPLWLPLLLSIFTLQPPNAAGQSYSIEWYKIAGGGGTSTNGQYAVTGTIGQHDAGGQMTGGGYSLTGGFWAIISVVQTPGLPNLIVTHSLNSVIVSWPDPNTNSFTLQQTANLAVGNGGWGPPSYSINWANGTNSIRITPPTGNLFFRLKQ